MTTAYDDDIDLDHLPPRHPVMVTSDRLEDHLDKYRDHFTQAEIRAAELVLMALGQVEARVKAARTAGVTSGH